MSDVSRKAHWEGVYTTKGEREVSWFQENPAPSLELIALAGLSADAAIIDIGGGASRLVGALVEQKIGQITVLDLSAAALDAAKRRLGDRGLTSNGWFRMSPPGSHPKLTICGTTALRFISSPMLPIVPPMSVISRAQSDPADTLSWAPSLWMGLNGAAACRSCGMMQECLALFSEPTSN